MAIKRIILLSGETEGPFLAAILRSHEANLQVDLASTKDELVAAAAGDLADTRLISFCSPVIVPADILARLPGPFLQFPPRAARIPGPIPQHVRPL